MNTSATTRVNSLLVVLNPNAGRKQGRKQFTKIVQPSLERSGKIFRLFETNSQGHAQSYFKDNICQLLTDGIHSKVQGDSITEIEDASSSAIPASLCIMVLGGDGTVHEVINGILLGLEDGSNGSTVPGPRIEFAIVPTGTGNAIATSLDITSVQDALDRFLVGNMAPLGVIKVSKLSQDNSIRSDRNHKETRIWKPYIYSVVVNSFGLHCATVADSEGFRGLGNARFILATLKNIVFLKQYKARVDLFGPYQRYDRSLREMISLQEEFDAQDNDSSAPSVPSRTLSGPFTYLMFTKQASLERGFTPAPYARASDEWLDILAVQNVGRRQILKVLKLTTKNGQHVELDEVEYYKAKAVELETTTKGRICIDGEFMDIEAGPEGRVRFEVVSPCSSSSNACFYVVQ
ncbi:hypothetical protein BG011_004464 [Mortierella polycephala]|uniref:DAGKc domain-containing protein n=1 Tax=Mortierella polycephala TaxID=41804 RepID=A0A9P6U1I4_9FUNG|nr:hypothetical protein BG011_004464 [Mortierella polycephala]